MLALATLTTLVLFAFVVSQPFFYWVALGPASGALSPAAYVELRQRINAVMNGRLPRLYLATLLSALWLLWVAIGRGDHLVTLTTVIAIAGLVTDAVLAVRRNVPINALMDAWNPAAVPSDWEEQRSRWVAAFATRQVVLTLAFASLLVGAVMR